MAESEEKTETKGEKGHSPKAQKPQKVLMRQKAMVRVVYALIPVALSAIYFFGWRVAAVLATVFAVGFATEYIMTRQRGRPVSMACFVTCMLFGLSLPPTIPHWIAGVGIVVAILFGKEVFGGFGQNFANPAIVGRAFVYVCFPTPMTGSFAPAFRGFPGGFAKWSFSEIPPRLVEGARELADAVSQASPMWVNREYGDAVTAHGTSWLEMFLGSISGVFTPPGAEGARVMSAGSMGEGCTAIILLAGVYLLVTKTANWRLMIPAFVGLATATGLLRHLLGYDGLGEVPPFHFTLVAGTTAYAAVFMVTDPVSGPKRKQAQYAYGFLIGFLIVLLRWKGIFVAAATFSILLGNLVGPLLDIGAGSWSKWRRGGAKLRKQASSDEKAAEGGAA